MSHDRNKSTSMITGLMTLGLAGSLLTAWTSESPAQAPKESDKPAASTAKLPPWQRLLKGDDAKKVQALEKQIADLEKKGQFAEAITPAREALAFRRRLQGEDHWQTVDARIDEETVVRVATLSREAQGELSSAFSHLEDGYRLDDSGRWAEAEPHFRRALRIRLRFLGEDHPYTATSYQALAFILIRQDNQSAEAQSAFEHVLAIRLRVLGEDHPLTAISHYGLACSALAHRRNAEAEPLFAQALTSQIRVLGVDHPDTARSYMMRGLNFSEWGKPTEAEPLLRKALAIYRRALGEDDPSTVTCYGYLAGNLNVQNKHAEAEPLLQNVLGFQRRTLGENHPYTAFSYTKLAWNLKTQGKYREAEAMAIAAAKSDEAARLQVNFGGLDRAAWDVLRSPLPTLAALHARLGRNLDAWQCWEASRARGLADELATRRRRLTRDDQNWREFLIDRIKRLDNQITALVSAKDQTQDPDTLLNQLRGQRLEHQSLLDLFEAELVKKHGMAPRPNYSLDQIQAQIPDDAAMIGSVDIKGMPPPNSADPRGDAWTFVVRRRGLPTWIRILGTGPDQSWTRVDQERPAEVRRVLREGFAAAWQKSLAEMADHRLGPLDSALRARGDLPAVRHLIVLTSAVLAGIPVEALLEARPEGSPRYLVSYSPSGTMFAWLQERRRENQDHLAQPRHLLALGDPVPSPSDLKAAPKPPDDGLLVRLVPPGTNAASAGIQPGDVVVSYAGTKLATRDDLQKQVQAVDPKASGIAVAIWREGKTFHLTLKPGPLGAGLDSKPAAEAILAQREAVASIRRSRGSAFTRLPATRREVQTIAALFDRKDVFLGSDASEQRLDELRAQDKLRQYSVVHLATHSKMDDPVPMNSRILLSQDHLPDPSAPSSLDQPFYDGMVTAGEVRSTWKLNAELVTLSACESGLGRNSGGEGFIGFAQAFFLAGARSMVLSLWEVDDQATSLLMTRFYQNWLGRRDGLSSPMSKAEALREAKAWLRGLTRQQIDDELVRLPRGEPRKREGQPVAAHPFEHPHYWAAFILMGDPG
jgi:tetratricopeptide (TPR) repeat protein